MEFDKYLKELGAIVGIPELAADDEGLCNLEIDDMVIQLCNEPLRNAMLLRGEIMPLSQEIDVAFLKQVLTLNFLFGGTRGATIAMNPENDSLELLLQIDNLPLFSAKDISHTLEEFVNSLEEIRKTLLEYRPQDGGSPSSMHGLSGLPDSHFFQQV